MSNDHHKARIGYLLQNSDRSAEEILQDGAEFEKFVKQEAYRYGVAHLKDVLHRMKREFGLVNTICNHLKTDEVEAERDEVMHDLRSFIYTDRIHSDDYIIDKDYLLVDEDIVRLILKHTTSISTFGLQSVLNEKQLDADAELDHGPQKRSDIVRKLANYMCAEEVKDRFRAKEKYFHESVDELCQADLVMYLHSEITEERRDLLPDLLDMSRNDIIDFLEEFFTTEELLAFETYAKQKAEDERKAEEIEQDKKDRIARDVKVQRKLDEKGGYADIIDDEGDEEGEEEKPTVSDVKYNNKKYRKFMYNKKRKEEAISKMTDQYRFKYVLKDIDAGKLRRNIKENMSDSVKKAFGSLGAHELRSLDTLEKARECLVLKYPHARMIIDAIMSDMKRGFMFGRREIQIRPVLLVGDPGSGKSSLARDIMTALNVYTEKVNAGGMFENHILGLSSGYASGMPSIITTAIGSSKAINPCIIVDEIDKTAADKRNGDIVDGLLSLFEPSESSEWYEKFLNMSVNASYVNWILTANDIDRVPLPLISRCTVYRLDNPGAEHVGSLVKSIVAEYADEVGVDNRFFSLSVSDVEYLKETMPRHRSVRILRQLVRLLLDEQESSSYHA